MLVISRKSGQKIMINDNIVITIVDAKNGTCKIAIDADKDVKIYREEIYYQIQVANLIGQKTTADVVNSVSDLLKDDKLKLNNREDTKAVDADVIIENNKPSKKIIIKKDSSKKEI